jgi:hypothetical protein
MNWWQCALVGVLTGACIAFAMKTAPAQHVHGGITLEQHIGEFYEKWKIAPARTASCCNKDDCAEVSIRRENNRWVAYGHKLHPGPVVIPDHKLEHNLSDPYDSPDGRSHVCLLPSSDGTVSVFCAVLGAGQ